jgi:hypothetical protein
MGTTIKKLREIFQSTLHSKQGLEGKEPFPTQGRKPSHFPQHPAKRKFDSFIPAYISKECVRIVRIVRMLLISRREETSFQGLRPDFGELPRAPFES